MTNEAQDRHQPLKRSRRSKARREREVAVIRHFRTVVKAIQAHSAGIERRCGVSASQLWALWEIHAEPGLRVKDVSERLSITPATASNLLDKIEGKGLIRRDRSGPDQRVVQLFPTLQGEALLANAPGPAEGALLNALARLDEVSLNNVASSLDALVEAFAIEEQGFAMAPISTQAQAAEKI